MIFLLVIGPMETIHTFALGGCEHGHIVDSTSFVSYIDLNLHQHFHFNKILSIFLTLLTY